MVSICLCLLLLLAGLISWGCLREGLSRCWQGSVGLLLVWFNLLVFIADVFVCFASVGVVVLLGRCNGKDANLVVVSKHDRLRVLDLVYHHCASSCNLPNLLKVLKTAQHYMQSNIMYVSETLLAGRLGLKQG
jgi:hypothetical protein